MLNLNVLDETKYLATMQINSASQKKSQNKSMMMRSHNPPYKIHHLRWYLGALSRSHHQAFILVLLLAVTMSLHIS